MAKKRSRSKFTKVCKGSFIHESHLLTITPEFVVHHSCVLAAAFSNTQFIEGKTQTYRLDDVRPNCFRLFVQWIYTQDFDLYTPKRRDLEAKPPKYDVFTSIITQDVDFAELWVLGDKFMIPGLQNKAIDKLLANSSLNVYNPAWFRYAYENTNDSSTLRKWAVDYSIVYIGNSRTGYVQTYREFYPKEMLLELLEKAAKPYPRGKRELTLVASDYYVETDV